MAYSIDLRERAMDLIDSGEKKSTVARLLKLSKRVLYKWISLRKETGNLSPKSGYQKGHGHKITDWIMFEKFAYQNTSSTTKKMAKNWTELTGKSTSRHAIARGLKKIGFTFKKKHFNTWKQMKKRGQSI